MKPYWQKGVAKHVAENGVLKDSLTTECSQSMKMKNELLRKTEEFATPIQKHREI